jgi:hypothetical protein
MLRLELFLKARRLVLLKSGLALATRRIRLSLHLLILVLPYNLGRRNRALARLNHYFYETKIFCLQRNEKRNGGRRLFFKISAWLAVFLQEQSMIR